MERRVLIAIFLSFLVLYVYQTYVVKPVPKTGQTAAQRRQDAAGDAAVSRLDAATVRPVRLRGCRAPPAAPAAATLVGDASERDVRVETQDVIAVFTNRGARLKSWRLKKYLDQQRQPQELIEHEI